MDSSNPKAPLATDLLLGTQGWRRFSMMGLAKFVETYGDKAREMLASRRVTPTDMSFNLAVGGGGVFRDGWQLNEKKGAFHAEHMPAPLPASVPVLRGATNAAIAPPVFQDAAKAPAPPPVLASAPVAEPRSAANKDAQLDLDKIQPKQEVAWAADMPVDGMVAGRLKARMNQDFRRAYM